MYNLLIVDDEELICAGIKAIIKRLDIDYIENIYTAVSVSHAKEIIKEHHPEMVITDITMPNSNGLDLIGWAKNNNYETRFVVLSGYDEFQYVKSAFLLGIDDYLLKPAGSDELKAVLDKLAESLDNSTSDSDKKILKNADSDEIYTSEKTILGIALQYINKNYNKDITMSMVANTVSVSYNYFSKIFKDGVGINFSEYLMKIRMSKALSLLDDPTNKVHEISQLVGYENSSHFTRTFKAYYGISPNEYRKKK